MGELSDLLRRSREQLGLTLEEVEALTHIKCAYLEALEAESFDALPNQVTARGFLRNYASALKLDVSHVLELYDRDYGHPMVGRSAPTRGGIQLKSCLLYTSDAADE